MKTRLEDLLATADRQLGSRSYDAAIDTCRTALGEPGAAEAGVLDRLEAASRVRDEALGIMRAVETPAPEGPAAETAAPPHQESATAPEPAPPQIDREPEPAPHPVAVAASIEPPAFELLEYDTWAPEETGYGRDARAQVDYRMEVEKVSILDPTPLLEQSDNLLAPRIVVACVIFLAVCALALLLK